MEKTISAAEANRTFSSLLRGVREGHSYVVTSHGKPVAKIVSANGAGDAAERLRRAKAFQRLMKRLRSQPTIDIGHVSREEMHER